ncbi:MAG: hypothetical protein IJK30_07270 [Ruminococcus sp.]|nr:hypothetical protein [Ruminococcus sp.]
MFGSKNDNEEYEYIENYFDSEVYGKPADRTQNAPKQLTSEYFERLFTPYLDMGEQILYAFGGGSGDEQNPLESEEMINKAKKYSKLAKVFAGMFALGVMLVFCSNAIFESIGFLMIIPYMLMPIALVGIVVAIIIWGVSKAKNVDYAITDKRLIILAYGHMQQVIYECITDVKCTLKSGSTGTITMKTKAYGSEPSKGLFIMPDIKDAARVAQILDDAIRNHIPGQYQ